MDNERDINESHLASSLGGYEDMWIAIKNHNIVAAQETFCKLLDVLKRNEISYDTSMKVLRNDTNYYFETGIGIVR